MDILHAHSDPTLLQRLKQMLHHSKAADIAVGYLFVSGFNEVAEEIAGLEKVRILVGRTDRPTLEEVARGLQQAEALRARLDGDGTVRRSAREEIGAQAVRTLAEGVSRMPQTDEAQCGIQRLRDLVASGKIEIKTYPRSMLHAKAYLCWYRNGAEPGAAIVGSSNFTLAGFTGNTELNVRVTGDSQMQALREWFEALWADSIDVTEQVAVELRRSWAVDKTPPYHVYLKALYELYKDELTGTPELEPKGRGVPELANFQLDAVRRGLRMVEQHGGCFIGDVVGLGKTYIGAELVRQLQFNEPPGSHPLIICPAGLKPMWEVTSERFGLGAAVVSMSAITPPPTVGFDEETGEYLDEVPQGQGIDLLAQYPNRGVVLVDEVHNFRHEATRRYRALSNYLWSSEHKVVLLSATPQNLGPADIYHQVRLFLDDLDHGLNIEPLNLEEYFRAVQRWYQYRIDVENWQQEYQQWQIQSVGAGRRSKPSPPPQQPSRPTEPFATIEQVLNPIFIRRRRRDIREVYGEDVEVAGKKVQFPEPVLENLFYRLDKVYEKAGTFSHIQELLNRHKGARYLAVEYLTDRARASGRYKDLVRARNRVARLMRYLLIKRLESSVEAFRSTLGVLIRSNRNFRAALDEGFVPIGETATAILSGETFRADELFARLGIEEERRKGTKHNRKRLIHSTEDFEVGRWAQDLDADYETLQTLSDAIANIKPEDDDKLRALRALLARSDVAEGKVLIFSEAEATVNYLYEQLNPGGADPTIERLSGANRDQLQTVIKRFAPGSNLKQGEGRPGSEVRVLIATDVISEGQNLQDCNRVLNYDLHWNPVRLIQRFGRVDRIGTTHQNIYLHNTWPDTDVDAELTLTERLRNRIQAFHDFIGLDTRLLSENERLNPGAMYRIYEEQRLPEQDDVLDEVAAFQRGIALLQTLQKDDPELWQTIAHLPDGIRSALPVRTVSVENHAMVDFQQAFGLDTVQLPLTSPQMEVGMARSLLDDPQEDETVVLFKHGDRPSTYAVGSDLKPRRITPGQFIAAVECDKDMAAAPLPPDTNRRVTAACEATRQEAATRLGRARRPGLDTRVRRYVSKQLRLAREQHVEDAEELRRIGILQQIFLDHLPSNVLTEIKEIQRMELTGSSLIGRLEAIRQRHRLNPPEAEDIGAVPADGEVVRTICSDGLVGEVLVGS
ncbi:MAG: phospholipase D-like domain-containing protein [Chloroflexota bacterium]|nr:phospholipase D-like domain-containing protein [Chloroflexota bacterium]